MLTAVRAELGESWTSKFSGPAVTWLIGRINEVSDRERLPRNVVENVPTFKGKNSDPIGPKLRPFAQALWVVGAIDVKSLPKKTKSVGRRASKNAAVAAAKALASASPVALKRVQEQLNALASSLTNAANEQPAMGRRKPNRKTDRKTDRSSKLEGYGARLAKAGHPFLELQKIQDEANLPVVPQVIEGQDQNAWYADILCNAHSMVALPDEKFVHANEFQGGTWTGQVVMMQQPIMPAGQTTGTRREVCEILQGEADVNKRHVITLMDVHDFKKKQDRLSAAGGDPQIRAPFFDTARYYEGDSEREQQVHGTETKFLHTWVSWWPDRELPRDLNGFVRLCRQVDSWGREGHQVVIHCSAGIGRTGTLAAGARALMYYRMFLDEGEPAKIDTMRAAVFRAAVETRLTRHSAIQTDEQLNYLLGDDVLSALVVAVAPPPGTGTPK